MKKVAIPSGRGIRSGRTNAGHLVCGVPGSQSPLVGAFVPAELGAPELEMARVVAIPSGRGIRSGSNRKPSPQQ